MRTRNDTAREPTLGELQKLLALKRYEVPPPGYFAAFASKVVARIEAGDPVESLSWWSRLVLALSNRPSLASGLALIVGLSLLGSIGVAPAVRSGSLERDLMLGSAPVAIQAALTDWSTEQASGARVQAHLGASSMTPVLARSGGSVAGLVLPARYSFAE